MKLALISPRIAIQKGDFLGSGVPYWPIELATLASFIRDQGDTVVFIDLFGENPEKLVDYKDYYLQGESIESYNRLESLQQVDTFIIFAISYMSHQEILCISQYLKLKFPGKKVSILENTQAVTAYSLQHTAKDFFRAGIDFLICGEPYYNWDDIKRSLLPFNLSLKSPSNLVTNDSIELPVRYNVQFQNYPVPAWDLIKLENYWKLPYSHGPKTKKFLPMLTSRGCPYPCDFCVIPETNNKRWHGRDPEEVVKEIVYLRDKYQVYDFQIEDPNPTVDHHRWISICQILIKERVGINFYFVSGTKAETIRIEEVALYAQAGCKYISISPESGSKKLMKIIGKKFDQDHGLNLIRECKKYKIKTQACFLVGHPNETNEDYLLTKKYLGQMVMNGVDEIAIFIVSAFAGSNLFTQNSIKVNNKSVLVSFSPKGRDNYKILQKRRQDLIRVFFIKKLFCGFDLWKQTYNSVIGSPKTKMENLPKRFLYILRLIIKNKFSNC